MEDKKHHNRDRKPLYKSKTNEEKGEDVIYGIRAVIEAIQAGRTLNKIMVQQGIQGDLFKQLKEVMKVAGELYLTVPIEKLNKVTSNNHQGVVAFASPIKYKSLDELIHEKLEAGEQPFIIILDRITDVRNIGAIARSAECFGVDALVVPARGSGMINADAIKTSAGALNTLNVCKEVNLKDTILLLKQYGVKIIACTEKSENLLPATKFKGPVAIIMGSEEDGVSKEYLKMADDTIKIPMYGTIESLNVSVSSAIVMYEITNQKNKGKKQ